MATKRAAARQKPEPENLLEELPSWLGPPLDALLGQDEKLHHGLLLAGVPGIGKGIFARHLAASLLCESELATRACGVCQSCKWMQQLGHPDLRVIMPEDQDPLFVASGSKKPSREIRIDQVRALASFMAVSSHRGGWRIVIIDPAEAMNSITANGLLKTLEEPGPQTLIILSCGHADRLPATIRSRCRLVPLASPPASEAIEWLLANGAEDKAAAHQALRAAGSPMHALQFIEPTEQAAHQTILETLASLPDTGVMRAVDLLDRHDPKQWAGVLQRWVADLARVRAGAQPHFYPDGQDRLIKLAALTDLGQLMQLQASIHSLDARIDHPLNARLICESAIHAYCRALSGRRTR